MNDLYKFSGEKGIARLTMTMRISQREILGISQSPTLAQRNSTAIFIDNASGIKSQASHVYASFNMVIPEALVGVKEIVLPGASSFTLKTTFQCP